MFAARSAVTGNAASWLRSASAHAGALPAQSCWLRAAVAAASGRSVVTAAGEEVFDKILIANRGEIACRVARTARKMGIKTVAIYSDPDAHAVHVGECDEAICVGPAPSDQSYLNIPAIMDAIKSTGAQAVHPGYGFLSENAGFARELEAAGIEFIGPGVEAITKMGDKIESKIIAKEAGVNTIPGYVGVVETDEEVKRISGEIGYPVMIKASAGGGGKGMRVAWNDEEAIEGFRLSKDEARSSFGDDRIFIEKYIEEPRHIEIQLVADKHGNVVALPERECSIQRRNQKVLEESPSVLLDEETRKAMGEQACMLARAVNYRSAGTVEFLCDKYKNFYFLEMNTRLQVEHPVSEYVSGIDLVEQMVRVAAGHELPPHMRNGQVPFKGWSMEARVYAEDPFRNFLPSTGTLSTYIEPVCGDANPNVRVDAGVREGSAISMFYDPMICKLVTYGETRAEALEELNKALDTYVIRGVNHNVPFLRDLCEHERFASGAITTNFIAEEYPDGFQGVVLPAHKKLQMTAASVVLHAIRERRLATVSGARETHAAHAAHVAKEPIVVTIDEFTDDAMQFTAVIDESTPHPRGEWVIRLTGSDGAESSFTITDLDWTLYGPIAFAKIDGEEFVMQHEERLPEGFRVSVCGASHTVTLRNERVQKLAKFMPPPAVMDYSNVMVSPMPGVLVSVAVEEGQHVEEGQELAVVEAMKMANVLRSPKKGVIKSIPFAAGSTLAVDDIIIAFEVDEEE